MGFVSTGQWLARITTVRVAESAHGRPADIPQQRSRRHPERCGFPLGCEEVLSRAQTSEPAAQTTVIDPWEML